MSVKRDRHGNPLYGAAHKADRKLWVKVVAAGGVRCWRCGKPIPPGSRWDLGHVTLDGRARGLPARHPEHIGCNRGEPFRRLYRQVNGQADPTVRDPKARFDGLPDPNPTNTVDRWSRHWDSGRFNPRCPDCRERRSMCDFALELASKDAEGRAA